MGEDYSHGSTPLLVSTSRQLLVKILLALGGTAAGAEITQATGAPATPPANVNATALYVDTNTGILYYWNVALQSWQ